MFALDERGINRLDLRNMLFREIVSNLLLHREFASTFSSKLLIFSDRVITENWTKPMQIGNVTLDTLETHTKNPLITKVFREMKWAEELGSGKKNIKKFAPLYYDKYKIEIQNNEKFVFSITYKQYFSIINNILLTCKFRANYLLHSEKTVIFFTCIKAV
jgi:ATP-dependent DNA helicase RecG